MEKAQKKGFQGQREWNPRLTLPRPPKVTLLPYRGYTGGSGWGKGGPEIPPFPPYPLLTLPGTWERKGSVRERKGKRERKGDNNRTRKLQKGGPARLKRPGVVGPGSLWLGGGFLGPRLRKKIRPLVYFFPDLTSNI